MKPELLKALEATPPRKPGELPPWVNSFLYGEFGVGKTALTGLYGLMIYRLTGKKHLVIATDTGTDTFWNHPEVLDSIEIVPYDSLSQLTAIGTAITEELEGYEQFGVVSVDTVSQTQEEFLDWLMDNFKFSGDTRTVATPKKMGSGLEAQEITGLADYHLTRNKMRLPIKTLIKAPADVFFLAHLREPSFLEAGKGKITKRPTVTETVYKLIAREVSLLGYMDRKGSKRTITFETGPKAVAKSRIKSLDNKTIDADDFPALIKEWKDLRS